MKVKIVDIAFSKPPYRSQFDKIEWDTSDVTGDEDLVVYVDTMLPQVCPFVKTKIAWLLEPRAIFPRTYDWIKANMQLYDHIFTHDVELLSLSKKCKMVELGACWIKEEDRAIHPKSKLLSIISSEKRITPYHNLRHEIIEQVKMDVYGIGYNPVENKIVGLKDYMFHVVVENDVRDYWFTEKLIDCFATGAVPIYCGCPSIGNIFDGGGIIKFNTIEELQDIVPKLNRKLYESMRESIGINFQRAHEYLHMEQPFYRTLNEVGLV